MRNPYRLRYAQKPDIQILIRNDIYLKPQIHNHIAPIIEMSRGMGIIATNLPKFTSFTREKRNCSEILAACTDQAYVDK